MTRKRKKVGHESGEQVGGDMLSKNMDLSESAEKHEMRMVTMMDKQMVEYVLKR